MYAGLFNSFELAKQLILKNELVKSIRFELVELFSLIQFAEPTHSTHSKSELILLTQNELIRPCSLEKIILFN